MSYGTWSNRGCDANVKVIHDLRPDITRAPTRKSPKKFPFNENVRGAGVCSGSPSNGRVRGAVWSSRSVSGPSASPACDAAVQN